jgi:hypothetical protein
MAHLHQPALEGYFTQVCGRVAMRCICVVHARMTLLHDAPAPALEGYFTGAAQWQLLG